MSQSNNQNSNPLNPSSLIANQQQIRNATPSLPSASLLQAVYGQGLPTRSGVNKQIFSPPIPGWTPTYKYGLPGIYERNPIEPLETVNTTEPLVGYRAWRVHKLYGKYYLQSTYVDYVWPHREKTTRGNGIIEINGHPPISDQQMGIHAMKEKHKLGELTVNYSQARVCGELYMWGEVVETQYGYKAQYAYPKNLFVMSDMDPLAIMGLEDGYGVPVVVSEAVELAHKTSLDWQRKLNQANLETSVLHEELNRIRREQDEFMERTRHEAEERARMYYYPLDYRTNLQNPDKS